MIICLPLILSLSLSLSLSRSDLLDFRAQTKPTSIEHLIWSAYPNILAIQERKDAMASWIVSNIIHSWVQDGVSYLEHFITVGKHLIELRNLNGCAQVLSAIDDTGLLRFDGLWGVCGQSSCERLAQRKRASLNMHTVCCRTLVASMKARCMSCVDCFLLMQSTRMLEVWHRQFKIALRYRTWVSICCDPGMSCGGDTDVA
jgi:hypothetical protein